MFLNAETSGSPDEKSPIPQPKLLELQWCIEPHKAATKPRFSSATDQTDLAPNSHFLAE